MHSTLRETPGEGLKSVRSTLPPLLPTRSGRFELVRSTVSLPRRRRASWLERNRTTVIGIGAAWAAGATTALLLDPRAGRRRRRRIVERGGAFARRGLRQSARLQRGLRSRAAGKLAAATHRTDRTTDYDDVTLAHKVETHLGRFASVPKGQFNVEACEGVVTLRGEFADEQTIAELVGHVSDVQGVRGIENLLHLPGTPAPNLNGQVQAHDMRRTT